MPFDTGILAIALAALSLCGAVGCLIALRRTRRTLVEQQDEVKEQLSQLNRKLAQLTPQAAAPQTAAQAVITVKASAAATAEPTEAQDELLAAVTAAAAAIVDRKVRVRSIQQVSAEPEVATAWSQQGRVIVQSSHNIGPHR